MKKIRCSKTYSTCLGRRNTTQAHGDIKTVRELVRELPLLASLCRAPASVLSLGNDTMVARSVDDTTVVAHSSDVLQFINNDVPRFSHLTYHTEVPMWNVLTKNHLNNFDIEIRDHKGHLFPRSAIADFVMVLMFEVVDEINENIDDVVAYQTQAYREGHPTSSGNIFS